MDGSSVVTAFPGIVLFLGAVERAHLVVRSGWFSTGVFAAGVMLLPGSGVSFRWRLFLVRLEGHGGFVRPPRGVFPFGEVG